MYAQTIRQPTSPPKTNKIWSNSSLAKCFPLLRTQLRHSKPRSGYPEMETKIAGPIVGMLMAECAQVGVIIVSKAAMSGGMSCLIFVVYSNALASLILLPTSLIYNRFSILWTLCLISATTVSFFCCRYFLDFRISLRFAGKIVLLSLSLSSVSFSRLDFLGKCYFS